LLLALKSLINIIARGQIHVRRLRNSAQRFPQRSIIHLVKHETQRIQREEELKRNGIKRRWFAPGRGGRANIPLQR